MDGAVKMKIGIASDHRGFSLKQKLVKYLRSVGYDIVDFGTTSTTSVDYTDFAFLLGEEVTKGNLNFGIAICGSGIGISIACNKIKGIRCAKVDSLKEAKLSRLDNDANIIALNGTMPAFLAKDILDIFLQTKFSDEPRHSRRIEKITEYENRPIRKTRKKQEELLKDES